LQHVAFTERAVEDAKGGLKVHSRFGNLPYKSMSVAEDNTARVKKRMGMDEETGAKEK
jgi:hypothetical protein